MKVDHIETCVCIDHEPTVADSVYYGMPQLKVTNGQEWSAFCPNCGRGGCLDFKSQYLALVHWNKMQKGLKNLDDILN
nr:MAG TPA: RNA polymerase III-like protein [Caudoviricetes sp.]